MSGHGPGPRSFNCFILSSSLVPFIFPRPSHLPPSCPPLPPLPPSFPPSIIPRLPALAAVPLMVPPLLTGPQVASRQVCCRREPCTSSSGTASWHWRYLPGGMRVKGCTLSGLTLFVGSASHTERVPLLIDSNLHVLWLGRFSPGSQEIPCSDCVSSIGTCAGVQ